MIQLTSLVNSKTNNCCSTCQGNGNVDPPSHSAASFLLFFTSLMVQSSRQLTSKIDRRKFSVNVQIYKNRQQQQVHIHNFKCIRPDDIDNASSILCATFYVRQHLIVSTFPKYFSLHLYHNLYVLRIQLLLTTRASISRRLTISLSARFYYRRLPVDYGM